MNFQNDRLGITVRDLNADNSIYVDFTDGRAVDDTHQLWGDNANDTVRQFFNRVLNGGRGVNLAGLVFDERVNAFRSK